MKINKLLIGLSLSCAMVFTACEDIIDVDPEFQKERSQIFKNLEEYEYALTGAYSLFRQTGYFGSGGQTTGSWSVLPDMMTDNLVQTGEDLGNWTNQVNYFYASDDSDIEIAWTAAYGVINQANLVLTNIDQIGAAEPKRVNRIKGQALAIRAMAHFDLLRYWGESYERNSSAKGVPYKTEFSPEELPARLSVKETYDKIFQDMTAAEAALSDIDVPSINASTNRGYIDLLVVRALMARMNLYAKEYAAAENYATLVIDAKPLASKTEFPGIWSDASLAEVIWSVTFSAGQGDYGSGVHAASSNRNRFRPSQELLNLYDPANDIRFPVYFATRQSQNVNPPRPIYPGTPLVYTSGGTLITRRILSKVVRTNGTRYDNQLNWKALRTGEMYLIRAEARAMQGGAKAVLGLADLNTLRAARINNYVPQVLAGQNLLDAIENERRRELVGEGHRWFDLKRTSRFIDREDITLNFTAAQLDPNAREWTWPIPQVEIDANPNISGQQTTGY
ncbi:RagB/SusD family nutrient uptake outer membrane protein [Rufibacter roseolus]|uniref:RagB/SusD family nutrient uptake outer membrane protein n=1 Tax=Rufibacter roseolus TaxID=2817375 RepID=UPI001B30425C|nr:RagB/SusD family nutrient uptake outer membrane protein [Rufibacter roseolus]